MTHFSDIRDALLNPTKSKDRDTSREVLQYIKIGAIATGVVIGCPALLLGCATFSSVSVIGIMFKYSALFTGISTLILARETYIVSDNVYNILDNPFKQVGSAFSSYILLNCALKRSWIIKPLFRHPIQRWLDS